MRYSRIFGLSLIIVGLITLGVDAQIPSVPSVPAAPAVPSVPSVPGMPQAPTNIWQQLCPTKDQIDKCKEAFCKHPMGKMISAMSMPFNLYSGGLMNQCCPPDQPNPSDLAQPATDAAGAAAAIKADEAGAKARRADMRYLGTVDCHYWPEAEGALIKGLRTDKNECVRWEAATSLGRGCCCTRKTIEALRITIIGSDKDGNPAELSDWVKTAALKSLNHCVQCFVDKAVPAEVPKEKPIRSASRPALSPILPVYYTTLENVPMQQIVGQARQALAQYQPPRGPVPIPTGRRTMNDVLVAGSGEAPPPPPPPSAAADVPLRPIPATGPQAAKPAPAPQGPPANYDLVHLWRNTFGSNKEPPRAPTTSAPSTITRTGAPPSTAPPVLEEASASRLPPAGNRDLFNIIKNSINGN